VPNSLPPQLQSLIDQCDEQTLRVLGIAAFACIVRIAAIRKQFRLSAVVRQVIVALGAGMAGHQWLCALEVSTMWRDPILILCAFFADDIVAVLLGLGRDFRKDPKSALSFFKRFLKK
jgi:uncharacterized membrane protein YeiH